MSSEVGEAHAPEYILAAGGHRRASRGRGFTTWLNTPTYEGTDRVVTSQRYDYLQFEATAP